MTQTARSRFGVFGILMFGVVIGYVIASTNPPYWKSVDAREADSRKVREGASAKTTPTASPVKATLDRDIYYPGSEDLGPNEMRVTACGTGMPNARPKQAAACWLVELGNGDKFLFDIGTGSAERISALQIPYNYLNKVFIGHLHSDHFGDLDALYCGGIVANRVVPLEVWGPNSIEPKYGTKAAMVAMEKMLAWDIDTRMRNTDTRGAFLKVTEFPYDAVNNGTLDATNVIVDITLPSNLTLQSVTTSSGTCSSGAGTVNCALGTVPGITGRTVDIVVTPSSVGVDTLSATVASDVDERPSNNQESVQFMVEPAVDLIVNTPLATPTLLDESTSISAMLENRSMLEATGVTLNVSLSSGLQADSASWSIGTCTIVTAQQVDCQAANFAAQSSSSLIVGVTGLATGNKNVTVTLASTEVDFDPANNSENGIVKVSSPDDEGGGATSPVFLCMLLLIIVMVRNRLGLVPGYDDAEKPTAPD